MCTVQSSSTSKDVSPPSVLKDTLDAILDAIDVANRILYSHDATISHEQRIHLTDCTDVIRGAAKWLLPRRDPADTDAPSPKHKFVFDAGRLRRREGAL